jgi:hypothetical protein
MQVLDWRRVIFLREAARETLVEGPGVGVGIGAMAPEPEDLGRVAPGVREKREEEMAKMIVEERIVIIFSNKIRTLKVVKG